MIGSLEKAMRELAEEELGAKTPDWFDDLFDYLFNKNQIVFFLDEDKKLDGFVCFWRYGKQRQAWIKKRVNVNAFDSNPRQMTKGDFIYIPISVIKKEKADGFLERSVDSIKRLVPSARHVCFHAPDGKFIRIKTED